MGKHRKKSRPLGGADAKPINVDYVFAGEVEEALFERVLIVLDPARDLEPALAYSLELVARWRPPVVALYTAFEEAVPFQAAHGEGIEPKMFGGKKVVSDFKRRLTKHAGKDIEVTKVVEEGPFEVTIPAVSAREGVDLLILGSLLAPMERRIVGSDTERVIEYAPCSVLLIRDKNRLPKKGSTYVFAHDGPRLAPRTIPDLVELAKATETCVQPVLGVPQKGLETGNELCKKLAFSLAEFDIEVKSPQVLTSRWVLGPHGVVHRAVAGILPSLAVLSRQQAHSM